MMNIQRTKVNLQFDMQIFHLRLAFHWMPLDRKLAIFRIGKSLLWQTRKPRKKLNGSGIFK